MTTYDPPVWTDAGPTPPAGAITYAATTAPPPPPPPAEALVPGAEAPAPDDGGRPADPRWARPALLVLLLVTAGLYLWDLGSSGWANSFYSAAVQAGSQSWKAMFFGSSDASNFITVDKSPLSLWPMEISARIFGVNAWSILVPQALMGVASVGVLYAAVKRWHGAAAGLIAGAVLALTPVAALMFRFNNPDAMLVLLLTLSAYALVRALETGARRWVIAVGAFIGLAFLAKSLQALVVLPGFAFLYLLAAPGRLTRRLVDMVIAGVALLVAGGWWVAIVEMWPASSRPYIGGSQNNSFLDLLFGYNGFGRLTGNETGSVVPGGGGAGGGTGMWGPTGLTRLFNSSFGGQASWLIPTALVLCTALLVWTIRRPRTDRIRASMILWGSWLVVTGLTISLGKGIIHEYYTVALAPAIGALCGIGVVELWRRRENPLAAASLALASLCAVVWSAVLLGRSPDFAPWLRPTVLVLGLIATLGVLLIWILPKRLAMAAVVAAGVLGMAGATAYTLETVTTPHSGAIPTAGPTVAGGRGGFPGGGGAGGFPGGGQLPGGTTGGTGTGTAGGTTGGGRAAGGLLDAGTVSDELAGVLTQDAESYTWIAATTGANSAAGYQLATGDPVMALGGFNGSDPWPTLEVFQQYVAEGKVHYYIAGGGGFGGGGFGGGGFGGGQQGGSSATSEIQSWVEQNFTATTVGGVTLYDLTAPAA
jgi:4-amino-4-deoxy-L-arabinose transferase-like glycosyltransferase